MMKDNDTNIRLEEMSPVHRYWTQQELQSLRENPIPVYEMNYQSPKEITKILDSAQGFYSGL